MVHKTIDRKTTKTLALGTEYFRVQLVVRGSIFEAFGEEPGQAWNVKEELKHETLSSDRKEQAAHFCPCCKTAANHSACWDSELSCKVSGSFGERGGEMNEKGVIIT